MVEIYKIRIINPINPGKNPIKLIKIIKNIFQRKHKISIIIPVLNEELTIGSVIKLVKKSIYTDEIIVIDDKSDDNTVEEAKKYGAKVFISAIRGKGYSMLEGLQYAKNEVVVYLDGDIGNYQEDIVEKLVYPIIFEDYDFVKSTFDREAGRVTELVAKPLLGILFPDLTKFSQPLSGMIAGKKSILKKIKFENDYGVDIGILIDVYNIKAKIKEVNIGKIENKSKPWQQLGKMSSEVAKAILKRAADRKLLDFDGLQSLNIIQNEMILAIQESLVNLKKIIVFNLNDVITDIDILKEFFIKIDHLNNYLEVISKTNDYAIQKKSIIKLLTGVDKDEFVKFIDSLPINFELQEVVKELKIRGYLTGIISESFDIITETIRKKIGMDFSLANQVCFIGNKFSGEVLIPSYFINSSKSLCNHPVCKSNALMYISDMFNIKIQDIIYVGDGNYDICPIRISGVGVAYRPKINLLSSISDVVIKSNIKEILKYAK